MAGTHFTYDEGNLEIVSVSLGHELAHHALVTRLRPSHNRSGQDTGFYFRHAAKAREIDPAIDPPPELDHRGRDHQLFSQPLPPLCGDRHLGDLAL